MEKEVVQPRTGNTIQSPKVVRRRTQMRHALTEAATRLFSERGFAQVSVEDLIEDVGISRRTFYGFFANKHELAAALINPIFDSALPILKDIEKQKDKPVIPAIVDLYLLLWAQHKSALVLLNSTDQNIFPYIEQRHADYGRRLMSILKRAEKQGELRNNSASYSFKIISRVAVQLLRIYEDHPDQSGLYRDGMKSLLYSKRKRS